MDERKTLVTESMRQVQLDDDILYNINKQLNRSRKIILLTGAGISCNAGIPDFRSATGLYDMVKRQYPDISIGSGKEMFDISLFRDEMKISVFATFMEKLYSSVKLAQPTKTHKFIAHLKNRGKLLRCYTQNIDGLEEILGLETSNSSFETSISRSNDNKKTVDVIQLHGDLNTLACTRCFHEFQWNRYLARFFRRGELPSCPECERVNSERTQQGKRCIGNIGYLRPNIVLYGENHPSGDIISEGLNSDINRGKPDFFIIMGTSLKVDGVKRVVKQISKQVHEKNGIVILINKTKLAESNWNGIIDYQICCDCDSWVEYLQSQIPDFFRTQQQVDSLRQLKREASELRKMKKMEQTTMKTPPSTPTMKRSPVPVKLTALNGVKRKLLTPENSFDERSPKKFSKTYCTTKKNPNKKKPFGVVNI
ncbi:NAD-dependent histone deacetylase HST3 [Nakaseomyces bracarensis]|uniref:NAD-dependent histone deacetylase HST3 n=1 Tax=Nakaseomyces bracarensis TaxID=273131 RepID=A0ABR4NPK4_9SACH